ncbi:hypothetical protein EDC04DRAFT_2897945 [Pisolithus marmoratus]|nr:hypothetical protein EDC04DRAFT_2897945 [Pisolithus marmoratus]
MERPDIGTLLVSRVSLSSRSDAIVIGHFHFQNMGGLPTHFSHRVAIFAYEGDFANSQPTLRSPLAVIKPDVGKPGQFHSYPSTHAQTLGVDTPFGSQSRMNSYLLNIATKATGHRIGDVGVVTEDGGFDVFFNICLPPTHPLHSTYGVPEEFKQIILSPPDISRLRSADQPGSVVATQSITQTNLMFGASGGSTSATFTWGS